MNAFRTLLAAAALLGTAASSSAFAAPLSMVNQGEAFSVQYEEGYTGNIVGGGVTRVASQGENVQIAHLDSRFAQQPAGIPVFVGGSEGSIAYVPAQGQAQFLANR